MSPVNDESRTEVEPSAAQAMTAEGAFLLDVREDHEWRAGHVEGSAHIPMGALAERQDELPSDRPIVAVCRSGARSGRVVEALRGAGYEAVNLTGGLQAWADSGLPLVSDDPTVTPHVA